MITYASRPHYAAHMAPVLPLVEDIDAVLVASYADVCVARKRHERIVLMQHGVGQSYSDENPAYPGGGSHNADVGLFLVPGEHPAQRWRDAYPAARVEVVGSPRLDGLPRRVADGRTTVAVTWHWTGGSVPETRTAFDHYREAVIELAERFHVIGHGHPRATSLPRWYAKHGIEWVPSFDDVCRRADVLVFDNTSAGFEFAATGRPVVVVDAPFYRADVSHGLRFYDAADVGVRVQTPADLTPAVERALSLDIADIGRREIALDAVFAYRDGGAQRAADAIREWAA